MSDTLTISRIRADDPTYAELERHAARLMRQLRKRRQQPGRGDLLQALAATVKLMAGQTDGPDADWRAASAGLLWKLAVTEYAIAGHDIIPRLDGPASRSWLALCAERDFSKRAGLMQQIAATYAVVLDREGVSGVEAVELLYQLAGAEARRKS